jgi:hypothetical protein
MNPKLCIFLFLLLNSGVFAQSKSKPQNPPALSVITEKFLRDDLYAQAGVNFRGRDAGTIDELKAAMWMGKRMQEEGFEPAGDDGTYFQYFNLFRHRISSSSTISIGDTNLKLWDDVLIAQTAPANITAPIIYIGTAGSADLTKINVKGKAVALQVIPDGINLNVSLPEWRYGRYVMSKYGNELLKQGAAAIIFVADEYAEHSWPYASANYVLGSFDVEGGRNVSAPAVSAPILWLHQRASEWIKKEGLTLKATLQIENFTYPSVNIIGKIKGTDPKLSEEYVLLSGHTDAHGIRNVIGNDSIYYGADDNASVNVAMFATAKALKKSPGKRSALLIIHGAEEKGLLGSRYFTTHPTIPLTSIAAVLNGDMIGRNHPDSAALLGSQVPHQTSAALTKMALDANDEGSKFKLDTLWDKTNHIEGWFFRSDHLPYVRLGIPSLMYTTMLHPDYHTPQDNAQNIDYKKLKKMTDWIYRTAWKVTNAEQRPATNPNFKLER